MAHHSQAEGTQLDGTQPDSIKLLDDLDEDQQLEQAIRQSLLPHGADMQPVQQQKPSMYDQDLERALAESMRTFEAEQQGSGGTAGRKRSSSDEHMTGDPQHQQPDHTPLVLGPQLQQLQQQPAGGALKRPRSISIPGDAGLLIPEQHPQQHQGSTMSSQGQQRSRLSRLHAGVVVTTSLQAQPPPQQQRQRLQGLMSLTGGVQRSASVTNAAAGRLPPFPSCGILQPATAQQQHQQHQQQQPLGSGLGRCASADDLQDHFHAAGDGGGAGSDGGSMEPAGSRPSSPQAAARPRRLAVDVHEPDAADDEDLYMDVPNSDDSMSSGIPTTHWAPGVLQAAAAVAVLPAAAPPAPRRIGPGPVVWDEGEWCIHDRLFYEGQSIYWQAYRNGVSYPGRVLTVEGGGDGSPVLYTAEIHQHPAGLRYVEASAGQLHPQLRVGDMVWCKPAAVKKACWSGQGPLFLQLHPLGPLGLLQPQTCEEAPWRMGVVLQVQLWHGQNPIAELRILGTGGYDTCWFRAAQLELVREIGESSSAAAKRAGTSSEQQQAVPQVREVQEDMDLLAGLEEEQQSQAQPSSLQEQQHQAGVDDVLLAADEQQQGVDHGGGALPPTTQQAVAALQQQAREAADGTPPPPGTAADASASPQPAAAPSLLSHRAATLTGESELEAAAAPAATVEQAAGADAANATQQQQQQQALAEGSAQGGKGTSQQQQQQQQHVVLEGTGESAEALLVEEVVGDSCGGPSGGCQAGDQGAVQEGEAEGAAPSPPQPLSNQLSGVEDSSPRPGQEGYGET